MGTSVTSVLIAKKEDIEMPKKSKEIRTVKLKDSHPVFREFEQLLTKMDELNMSVSFCENYLELTVDGETYKVEDTESNMGIYSLPPQTEYKITCHREVDE